MEWRMLVASAKEPMQILLVRRTSVRVSLS